MTEAPDRHLRTYPEGVPCWVDHDSPDLPAASQFYGALLGWQVQVLTPDVVPVQYAVATSQGQDAAGLAGPVPGPAAWHTYLAVDDVDDAVRRVVAAGGTLLAEPADVGPEGTAGRSADCADPAGVGFRLWQARDRVGVQALNRPDAWSFSNLHTPDPDAATAFYGEVFGWLVVEQEWGRAVQLPGYGAHLVDHGDPTILERQAEIGAPEGFADVIASIVPVAPGAAAGFHVTFTVADRDAAAARVRELGGEVRATYETGWTREAHVTDPLGATLVLSQFAPPG